MWIDYRKGMAPQSLHAPGYTPLAAVDPARSPFFAATSFITSISRSRSATSFFSRPFSASSCRRRLTSRASPHHFENRT